MPAGDRYVEISLAQMDAVLIEKCGFERSTANSEYIYTRRVSRKTESGVVAYPMTVKVRSTIDVRSGTTRNIGSDSILIMLLRDTGDVGEGVMVSQKWYPRSKIKVFRTKSALDNLYKGCREMFALAYRAACPKCGHVLAPRNGKNGRFYGCTQYPTCTGTRPVEEVEIPKESPPTKT